MALTLDTIGYTYAAGTSLEMPALADVSLAVTPGELVLVLGRDRVGQVDAAPDRGGLLGPLTGSRGSRARRSRARLRAGRVGLVFQDPESQLFADTVLDDVAFGPRNLGAVAEAADRGRRAPRRWGSPDGLAIARRSRSPAGRRGARRSPACSRCAALPAARRTDRRARRPRARGRARDRAPERASARRRRGQPLRRGVPGGGRSRALARGRGMVFSGAPSGSSPTRRLRRRRACSHPTCCGSRRWRSSVGHDGWAVHAGSQARGRRRAAGRGVALMAVPVPFGQYVPGDSPVHRLDPRAKLGLVAAYTVSALRDPGLAGVRVAAVIVAVAVVASRVPWRIALRGLRPIALLLAFTLAGERAALAAGDGARAASGRSACRRAGLATRRCSSSRASCCWSSAPRCSR